MKELYYKTARSGVAETLTLNPKPQSVTPKRKPKSEEKVGLEEPLRQQGIHRQLEASVVSLETSQGFWGLGFRGLGVRG